MFARAVASVAICVDSQLKRKAGRVHGYPTYDAPYWQRRAKEFRDLATRIEGADAKAAMLTIAEHYDRLASDVNSQPSAKDALSAVLGIRRVRSFAVG